MAWGNGGEVTEPNSEMTNNFDPGSIHSNCLLLGKQQGNAANMGLSRESNPGPLAPEARIMPLDQAAGDNM